VLITNNSQPIGIFDSGLGGLSVVNALIKLLPGEDIVYFGDTGRVPYGTRSRQTIEGYTRQDIAFLQSKNVKLIIAACGTVSSVASHVGETCGLPFLGVVKPTAAAAVKTTKNKKIGVIGTAATIASNSYSKEIALLDPSVEVFGQPCQLFVQMVEEGFLDVDDPIPNAVCRRYLQPLIDQQVDTLILGCTHFPLLAPVIRKIMGEGVTLIDSGHAAADYAAHLLKEKDLLNPNTQGKCSYFVSDRTDAFSQIAGRFLGKEITDVTRVNWE
jgi:glutamate racemase